ncbi:HAMP domain-containing histidine kinase [Sulfurimonas sp. SAG-AH-194-L11]|nr:HAMP domain-containing histidine kinase [Sulfurimonas sp. SAG-AH-194-L11]
MISSIPLVYLFSLLLEHEYELFLLELSILLPLVLTPMTIALFIRLTTNMTYYKNKLAQEIDKNKTQNLILFEQARFALMGEMMVNISHQWKQPLNTMSLSLVDMRMKNLYVDVDSNFEIIEKNINYLATTVDDFMSFFDKRTHLELKSLQEITKEIHSIIDPHLHNNSVKLKLCIDEKYASVRVASSISQVILNLVNNAKDALIDLEDKTVCVSLLTSEKGLEIECCDSGKGVPPELQEKIFMPYFTTKQRSKGTGIGLYMSKEIVTKIFEGEINVSQRKHSRTCSTQLKSCFYILLPYSDKCQKREVQ